MTIMKGGIKIAVAKFCNGISDICKKPRKEYLKPFNAAITIISSRKEVSYNGLG